MSPLKRKKLNKIRLKLDKLDNSLIKIIKQRTNLVNQVLKLKDKKKEIVDNKRIKIILKNIRKKSLANKIDHIIKKLNIKPNQKVLDIGSGWGTLAINIAQKTQASVTGITLSENQLEFSKNKAKELNLENQVEFKLIDYREINEKFDRIVSVGMFEHVGRKFYGDYFNSISKLLNEKGISLIHTIGSSNPPRDPQPWITKYIFPGVYSLSIFFHISMDFSNNSFLCIG